MGRKGGRRGTKVNGEEGREERDKGEWGGREGRRGTKVNGKVGGKGVRGRREKERERESEVPDQMP